MKLYSYVVARDFGFAPNPFYGICTLATCKPHIRRHAKVGDWILGTGAKKNGLQGRVIYAMRVSEALTYNEYWSDARFRPKRPNLRGSLKQAYGDNIYYQKVGGDWHQEDSHHSYENGRPNLSNINRDTQTSRVLIGEEFYYWGRNGPLIPDEFRNFDGHDICTCRGHKCKFPESMVTDFVEWLVAKDEPGFLGEPLEFG